MMTDSPLLKSSFKNRRAVRLLKATVVKCFYVLVGTFIGGLAIYIYLMNLRPELSLWHTVHLDEEYTIEKHTEVNSFSAYLALEERLFQQLQTEVYEKVPHETVNRLNRFDQGSMADPSQYPINWNRSFILKPEQPRAGVLLLHGLSDSPYSLRALAQKLYQQGYYVIGLRMPGHGTAPSGIVNASWQDMASAVQLAAEHLSETIGPDKKMVIVGYSMGAAQAVNYSLNAMKDNRLRNADSLVLISPAIGVSSVAALAVWQSRLSILPGMNKLAWTSIGPEYDPYKYNSFAVNAGDQMYRLTQTINNKLLEVSSTIGTHNFPKMLAVTSLVDATVSTQAVITQLFDQLDNSGNELVIFDINRNENFTLFLKKDPINNYYDLLKREKLTFDLTLFASDPDDTDTLLERITLHSQDNNHGQTLVKQTGMQWPQHIYSLSHVALPFAPTDSLYGATPDEEGKLHIGELETKGEKGVLNIAASDMLRLRYNPFYASMESKIMDFIGQKDKE